VSFVALVGYPERTSGAIQTKSYAEMMTLSACVLAAFAKVS